MTVKVITELPHKEDELFYGTKQEQLEVFFVFGGISEVKIAVGTSVGSR